MRMLITGVLFLIGSLLLGGTASKGALAVAGLVTLVIGVIQLARGGSDSTSVSFPEPDRDDELMQEYLRAKAEDARAAGQVTLADEVAALMAQTPGAAAKLEEVLQTAAYRRKQHATRV